MRSATLLPLLLLPLTACSASLELLATVDDQGTVGAQVTVDLGIAFAYLDGPRQVELSFEEGLLDDGPTYALAGVGVEYSDAVLGEGFGHRAGLHLALLPEATGDESDDLLGEVALSWSLLANLDVRDGYIPHMTSWVTRDQLGLTLYAAYRGQLDRGARSHFVFGAGPRFMILLTDE